MTGKICRSNLAETLTWIGAAVLLSLGACLCLGPPDGPGLPSSLPPSDSSSSSELLSDCCTLPLPFPLPLLFAWALPAMAAFSLAKFSGLRGAGSSSLMFRRALALCVL